MRNLVLPLLAVAGLAGCTHYDRGYYGHDGYSYAGNDWGGRLGDLDRLDPWLDDTEEGQVIVDRWFDQVAAGRDSVRALNIRFRRFADTDRDLRLTDREIRLALVRCAGHGWSW